MFNNQGQFTSQSNNVGLGVSPLQTIRVIRLVITQTNSYGDQFIRPLEANIDASVKNTFEQHLSGLQAITPDAVAPITVGFLAPSAQQRGVAQIANGWGTQRLRFMMEIEVTRNNLQTRELVNGYTDHPGIAMGSKSIDPNMIFVINNITKVSTKQIGNREIGFRTTFNTHGTNQVVFDSVPTSYLNNDKQFIITPRSMMTSMVPEAFTSGGFPGSTVNAVASVTTKPTLSNQSHTSPVRYVSKVLNSFSNSFRSALPGSSDGEVIDNSIAMVLDDTMAKYGFSDVLYSMYNNTYTGSFTMRDLLDIDPNTLANTNIAMSDAPIPVGSSEYLSGADICTTSANVVSQSLPAIMSDFFLTKLSFSSTNRLTGQNLGIATGFAPVTQITDARGFYPIDMAAIHMPLVDKINLEIIRLISNNGMFDYDLHVAYDVLGTTTINISIGNYPSTPFIIPSFCNSTNTAVITNNYDDLTTMKDSFESLTSIFNDFRQSNPFGSNDFNFNL